ncbi:hypothetical protein BpHYR1_047629 [Brachionus plicatilis]|uniref:Uncharacterized protein n=1 Tax=Brachionus plicatilis TaxID=10195 RepID=A0A3M7P5B8_BRAPC|nr:hypothetical protein BpHYR1_047629 [Brachionus plicatilis]
MITATRLYPSPHALTRNSSFFKRYYEYEQDLKLNLTLKALPYAEPNAQSNAWSKVTPNKLQTAPTNSLLVQQSTLIKDTYSTMRNTQPSQPALLDEVGDSEERGEMSTPQQPAELQNKAVAETKAPKRVGRPDKATVEANKKANLESRNIYYEWRDSNPDVRTSKRNQAKRTGQSSS